MKKNIPLVLSIALSILVLPSCKKKVHDANDRGTVRARLVYGPDKVPLKGVRMVVNSCYQSDLGASVCLERGSAITDADGRFSISFRGDGKSTRYVLAISQNNDRPVDSIYLEKAIPVYFGTRNEMDVAVLKRNYSTLRVLIHKNEGYPLRLNAGAMGTFNLRTTPGPVDTTMRFWGNVTDNVHCWVFTYNRTTQKTHSKKIPFPIKADNSYVETVEVDDMLLLPAE